MAVVLILTDPGCEEACVRETREILGKEPKLGEVLTLECNLEDAFTLAYNSKTALRVLVQIAPPVKTPAELNEPDMTFFPEGTFKVEGEVRSEGMTQELIEDIGGWLHKKIDRKVDLKKPDVVVYAIKGEKIHVGIDLMGDLSKRQWRIMLSRRSLRATIAAATVVYATVQPGMTVLDPFGDDGTIGIEAALLLSKTSVLMYEKQGPLGLKNWESWKKAQDRRQDIPKITIHCESLREMQAVRTNSKLAGVDKLIHSTKSSIEWTGLKLEKGSIDRIITHAPESGKSLPEKKAQKLLSALFEAAARVLSKDGTMTCVTQKPDEVIREAEGFSVKEQREVRMGKLPLSIVTFTR